MIRRKAVYKQMLKELDEVSSVLKENLTIGSEAFRKFDDVYYGDVSKWYKFANSLKLRMAIRMAYVDPTTAQQVAQDAVDAGVITDNADNAEMKVEENRAAMVFNGWSDHRIGADLLLLHERLSGSSAGEDVHSSGNHGNSWW